MGKLKNVTKGESDVQKGISPTALSHMGKAGDRGDVDHDLRDEVALVEKCTITNGHFFQNALSLYMMWQIVIRTIFIT